MQIENKLCIHLKVEKCFCWGNNSKSTSFVLSSLFAFVQSEKCWQKLHCLFHTACCLYLLSMPDNTDKHCTDKFADKCYFFCNSLFVTPTFSNGSTPERFANFINFKAASRRL